MMDELESDITNIEERVRSREEAILEAALAEALKGRCAAEAETLKPLLRERAQLRRYEHGGSFVVVRWEDAWLPLDRAVSLMAEKVIGGREHGKRN